MARTVERYIVTYVDVDRDGQCDGKPKIGAICKTEEEAKAWIQNDIQQYIDEHTSDEGACEFIADFGKMNVHTHDWSDYTEWQFEKCGICLDDEELQ